MKEAKRKLDLSEGATEITEVSYSVPESKDKNIIYSVKVSREEFYATLTGGADPKVFWKKIEKEVLKDIGGYEENNN